MTKNKTIFFWNTSIIQSKSEVVLPCNGLINTIFSDLVIIFVLPYGLSAYLSFPLLSLEGSVMLKSLQIPKYHVRSFCTANKIGVSFIENVWGKDGGGYFLFFFFPHSFKDDLFGISLK